MAIERARNLRRNQTEAEQRLWNALRDRQLDGAKFRRQVPLPPYFGDFVCFERKLVVELDGGQHAEREDYDETRTKTLEQRGYRILRFWNNEVMGNLEGVIETIRTALND
jgi:very-short-patch-repair endonuclease